MEVRATITSATEGTSVSTGTEMSEADFLILIQDLIKITETSVTSVKITSLALTVVQAQVAQDKPWSGQICFP